MFAPGLENLARTGAVHEIWDAAEPLAHRLAALLENIPDARDIRDALGKKRGGRMKAFDIARRVQDLATTRA